MKTGSGNNEKNVFPNKGEMSFLDSCSDDWRGLRRGMKMEGSPYGTSSICTNGQNPHAMPLVAWCVYKYPGTYHHFVSTLSKFSYRLMDLCCQQVPTRRCVPDGLIIGAKERKESPDVDLKLLLRLLSAMQKQIQTGLLNANRRSRMD
jgi:hypothetical protein